MLFSQSYHLYSVHGCFMQKRREALCGVQVRKPSDKAKAGWVSLGESGFPVQILLALEGMKPISPVAKGAGERVPLN